MNHLVRSLAAGCVLALGSVVPAQAELAYGLGLSNSFFQFDTTAPGAASAATTLTGIAAGQTLRAMDVRPATGQLYAIATSNTDATQAQVYVIDPVNRSATAFGGTIILAANASTRISMDWNPVVDRLRIVTGSAQNYRFNPTNFAIINDGTLAYAAGDPSEGANPLVAAIAYTNNFAGATTTTLYGWDFAIDNLLTIGSLNGNPTSPNDGTLFTIGGPPVFVSLAAGMGMDISGLTGTAFINFDDLDDDGVTTTENLATVNLADGNVNDLGAFPAGLDVIDFAVATIPEPGSVALTATGLVGLVVYLRRRRNKVG